MLVAAASSAFDREQRESEDSKKTADDGDDPTTSRKLKSLALLCKRYHLMKQCTHTTCTST